MKKNNPRIIVALDVPDSSFIKPVVESLPERISHYKIGLEIFCSEGPLALDYLKTTNKNVFLDLKLHDIPRTVAHAVKTAASHGVNLLTVHAGGGRTMLEAAANAARSIGTSAPKLLAVTTLTSLDENDLIELGITRPLQEHTLALGKLAIESGIDGLVCSPHEAAAFREMLGPSPLLVTPGIRPAGANTEDQKRVATPAMAVKAGADFLVIGRPIMQAANPAAAAEMILKEIDEVL